MSTPHRHRPQLPVRDAAMCMCVHGEPCSVFARGHALHLIQSRLASATPTDWQDGIVTDVSPTGDVTLTLLSGAAVRVWNRAASTRVVAGDPVALHARYDVLAYGPRRYNVLRAV